VIAAVVTDSNIRMFNVYAALKLVGCSLTTAVDFISII